jgi:GxxExxY protein
MLIAEELTREVIGAAIEVHRQLGPGLLESAYEACLIRELELRGLAVQHQVALPVHYKGEAVNAGFRLDLVVEGTVIIEIKCVEQINDLHRAQLLTYLKLSGRQVGLILDFNTPVLKDGIVRMVL